MMQSQRIFIASACSALLALSLGLVAGADRFATQTQPNHSVDQKTLHEQVNEVVGLSRSELMPLPTHHIQPSVAFELAIPIQGQVHNIHLTPHSNRAEGFRVRAQIADGSLVDVDPGPIQTVRGFSETDPDMLISGAVHGDGLLLSLIRADGETFWIEPVAAHIVDADHDLHVIYNAADADCDEGTCGGPFGLAQFVGDDEPQEIGGGTAAGINCMVAEIAIDADFPYYQALGSNVDNVINNVEQIINTINIQYENQVGIVHEITEIVVRTSSAQNPYTTNQAGTLLSQFRNVWSSAPESSIPRDLAHLLTGQNLSGSTIGIAWLGSVCQSIFGNHYALSQRLTNFNCMTDLVAHELGHNWSAQHCSCPGNTMNPSLTCANSFSSGTANSILSFKNNLSCLEPCLGPPPENNTCNQAVAVGEGTTTFSTTGATTEGPVESEKCDLFGDNNVQADAWFTHTAQCDGELTISLCGSDFVAKLAVYDTCPTQPNTATECDVNGCPETVSAELTIDVESGQDLLLRVGGHLGQHGDAVMTISCEEAAICHGDITGTQTVDVDDLLVVLNSWGQCSDVNNCPADVSGDGVVDVDDLLVVLNNWGSCP